MSDADSILPQVNWNWWPPPPQWRQGYTDPGLPPRQVNPAPRSAVVTGISAAGAGAAWNYSAGPEARAAAMRDLAKILARNVGGAKPKKFKKRIRKLKFFGRRAAIAVGKKAGRFAVLGPLGTVGGILAGAATVYDVGKVIYDRVKVGTPIQALPSSGRTTGTGGRGGARRAAPAKAKSSAPGASHQKHAEIVKQAEKKAEAAAPAAAKPAPVSIPKKKTLKELVAEIKARPAPAPSKTASAIYKYAPKAKELLIEFSKIRNKPRQARAPAPQVTQSSAPLEFVQASTGMAPLTSFEGDRVTSRSESKCKCPAKKKRGKRKPRTVCYKGSYTETAAGISKRKRERVPCRP